MRSILDLIVPTYCAGCDTPGAPWCTDCDGALRPFPVFRPDLGSAWALSWYGGPARRAVLAYKERGRHELASALGAALARALPTVRAGPFTVVPAPSRPSAARARYGQHMTAVAHACANALSRSGHEASVADVLRLSGRARDSVGLTPTARATNLRGRLHCTGPAPRRAVLLDDVITTGATATACATALREGGTEVTTVLALTATT